MQIVRSLRLIGLTVALAYGAAASASATSDLGQIESLIKAGAPRLALSLIDRDQPLASDPAWAVWERVRYAAYHGLNDWSALAQRAEQLPPDATPEFRRYAMLEAADAHTRRGDGESARRVLRQALIAEALQPAQAAHARRLVIRSYLVEDNLDDALTALARYRVDFGARSEAWRLLHAEIALRAERDREAYQTLAGLQSFEARLLRLLAGLRAAVYRPAGALADSRALAKELKNRPALARQAWGLAARAAVRAGDARAHIEALESALAVPESALSDPLFAVSADELWQAYDTFAEAEGNRARLLVGDDRRWMARARKLPCRERLQARAMYAFLSRVAVDPVVRAEAHDWLGYTLFVDGKPETAQALYMRSTRFGKLDAIPATIRYRLADKALAEYNVKVAAELVRDLDAAPPDEDADLWALRRARMLVYADEIEPGVALLTQRFDAHESLSDDLADRYLQVLFDLQTLNRHSEAARLLARLYELIESSALQREVLFWRADSAAALKRPREAAELYLLSATHGGANGLDPWGETARYRAAEELGKAGLVDDARNLYQGLLRQATDPKRRIQIERNMQQLWLVRSKPTTP
ncbi:MAG: hypothetical protein JSW09_03185 [Pseudomonadota bacterium]|nr:MAG: hypothetical protein JSW09_03185 [Pseudomonadota bacterium]